MNSPLLPGLQWFSQHLLPVMEHAVRAVLPASYEPFPFMHRAVLACILIAPMCAAMGVKVVNFRMAFFSDAISHSAFAGIAFGFLLHQAVTQFNFDPRIAMVLLGVLVGLGIARELTGRRRNRVFAYDRYLAILNEGTEAP